VQKTKSHGHGQEETSQRKNRQQQGGVGMTDLKLLILSVIQQRGPQSDMALWGHTHHCQSLISIVMATAELENEGLVMRSPFSRNLFPTRVLGHELITYWNLTEKGRQFMPAPKEAHAGTF
jgi:hypothetical protein